MQNLQASAQKLREDVSAKDAERKYLTTEIEKLRLAQNASQAAMQEAQTAVAVAQSQKQALVDKLEERETELALRKDQWATVEVLEASKKRLEQEWQNAVQAQARSARDTPAPDERLALKEAENAELKQQLAAAQIEIAENRHKAQRAVRLPHV